MSAEDFCKPGEPTQAHWRQAMREMAAEGHTVKSWVDGGGTAKGFFDTVLERADRVMRRPKPLPPLPPRKLPPLPPRPLPLPPRIS
jgi:hypothetical protein